MGALEETSVLFLLRWEVLVLSICMQPEGVQVTESILKTRKMRFKATQVPRPGS